MSNNDNLISFNKGVSGNPKGRPKGSKNRSTIVRDIFDSISVLDCFSFNDLESKFPHIKNNMSIEYLMTLIQVNKAIFKEDTRAYKVLMESLYGTPIKEVLIEPKEETSDEKLDLSLLTVEELDILLKAFNRKEPPKDRLGSEWGLK